MNYNHLSNEALHSETLNVAAREKSATLALLEFLAEVDARRLYNARGYSSLWEYVHLALGCSEASASERVSAMRLMQRVPEVKVEIASNRLTLTAASRLASFVKREKCTTEKTAKLLLEVTAKPTREVDRVLAAHQTIAISKPDSARLTGPETTRIAFDADPEFITLYEELRNLQGRPDWTMKDRIKEAMREMIARKKKFGDKAAASKKVAEYAAPLKLASARGAPLNKDNESVTPQIQRGTTLAGTEKTTLASLRPPELKRQSRYISVATRSETHFRSGGQCEFRDPVSKRRCTSRFGLNYDHVRPFAKGGGSEPENIRHLCPSHNQYAAVREFGAMKVRTDQALQR